MSIRQLQSSYEIPILISEKLNMLIMHDMTKGRPVDTVETIININIKPVIAFAFDSDLIWTLLSFSY